jgi:hypothetical protein
LHLEPAAPDLRRDRERKARGARQAGKGPGTGLRRHSNCVRHGATHLDVSGIQLRARIKCCAPPAKAGPPKMDRPDHFQCHERRPQECRKEVAGRQVPLSATEGSQAQGLSEARSKTWPETAKTRCIAERKAQPFRSIHQVFGTVFTYFFRPFLKLGVRASRVGSRRFGGIQ